MKIAVAGDHRGIGLKDAIINIASGLGHECVDLGTSDVDPVDYPDLAYAAATKIIENNADKAILVCATGMGMNIVANKIKGIRAVTCHDEVSAQIAREQKDANVLCLSGDTISEVLLRRIVEAWLTTEFAGGRHQRKIDKIKRIEEGTSPE